MPSLLEKTQRLLAKDKRNLMDLSRQTGLGYFWLRKFKAKKATNPGVRHVQTLHDFLSK